MRHVKKVLKKVSTGQHIIAFMWYFPFIVESVFLGEVTSLSLVLPSLFFFVFL